MTMAPAPKNIHIDRYNKQPERNKTLMRSMADWRVQTIISETLENQIKPIVGNKKELAGKAMSNLLKREILDTQVQKELFHTMQDSKKRIQIEKDVYTSIYGVLVEKGEHLLDLINTIGMNLPYIQVDANNAYRLVTSYALYLKNLVHQWQATINQANVYPTETIDFDKSAWSENYRDLTEKDNVIEQNTTLAKNIIELNKHLINS